MNDLKKDILSLIEKYNDSKNESIFIPGESPVPVSGRVYDNSDVSMLIESALEFWLTTGRFNEEFESNLAKFLRTRRVLTVNSGSSANLLAFSSLKSHLIKNNIQDGDEVITVAAGFPTTVNPIIQNNCIPVFVDVELPGYNIDTKKIEAAITKKTKAIMIAHTLGNPFEVDEIQRICKENNLFLVEDCCDALGSEYNGVKVGSFGDVATLSFYPAHHITMGEGGAVFSSKHLMLKALESIRDWGRDCWCPPGKDNTCGVRFNWKLGDLPKGYDHKYIYSHLGYNLKITDMQAAVGLAQLGHLEEFISTRKRNFNLLKNGLSNLDEKIILPVSTKNSDPSWFGFPITVREQNTREKFINFLNEKKIGTRLIFAGNLVKQPYMKNLKFKVSGDLKNTDTIMNDSLWIGVYPGLNENMINYMLESIHEFFKSN
jgi:CDP-6-deoxy-D-xylo-4-hexulose-3-dehydrase